MKLRLRTICLAALTLFAAALSLAQTLEAPSSPSPKIAGGKKSFSIPFELVDNRIFVKVRLNGRGPYHFLIDTGGYASVSMDVARSLGLPMGEEGQGAGAGQNVVVAHETKIAEIQLGDLTLTNQDAYASTAYVDARHVFGSKPFDGVLGLPLFQKMVVKVDYERGRLTFIEGVSFKYAGAGVVVPFELDRFAPIVRGELDGVTGRFTIDTGARSSLLLRGPFVESNGLRAKYAPKVEAVTGWGNGGPIRSQVTRAKTLKLGPLEVHNPVTLFSLQKSGLLATMTSDAGLVGAGGPAAEAGLTDGDRILSFF